MNLELMKIKVFYYNKALEFGSYEEASKLIQYKNGSDEWLNVISPEPVWSAQCYRIKPNTVIHPGGEMPTPMTVKEAEKEVRVYTPFINCSTWLLEIRGYESLENKIGLAKFGFAFKTREDAVAAGHVIFNIPKSESKKEYNL